MSDKKAWDSEKMGFDKHDYHHIDPSTINVDEFARSLRGEETHFGDIRQYNSGYNEKHEENDLDLDWLSRVGTVFTTEAKGYEGLWKVSNMPIVHAPHIYCRAVKVEDAKDSIEGKEEVEISCTSLGCSVNPENLYEQVRSKLVKKGSVAREQRERLTKRS